jgi:putative effector of murein hydrolase
LEKLSIPSFEMDYKADWKLNAGWIPLFLGFSCVFLASPFFQKSRALLDVKDIFIHFFYPW